ncbi:hypothetical protein PPTG_22752 [Phytophthora nicotianae INRA-310]|uniref:Uncharacterized protein n=1 Tax=Phytophthora nicotianae (strain INRA-310) TaxID=761204 RepID=W2QDX8_PHYN3|nr:hypothetical protein PPTG_22752 [Phytophthora nicotianae INRA-310]ETN10475.1 hypothetical protein PPTG_22752 [Phytophthora nicotianae INRA-310]
MRISLSQSDDTAILEEAFALIDSYEGITSARDSSIDSTGRGMIKSIIPAYSKGASDQLRAKDLATKKKRTRRPETSSVVFQRRRKTEIVDLRAEVAKLESHLKYLQQKCQSVWYRYLNRNRSDTVTKDRYSGQHSVEINWAQEAVKQYQWLNSATESL